MNKALARNTDPQTSHDAVKTVNVNRLEGIFLDYVRRSGALGITANEICNCSGLSQNSITPRSSGLRRKGLIRDSGRRRGKSIVWVLGSEEDPNNEYPQKELPFKEDPDKWEKDVIAFLKKVSNSRFSGCLCSALVVDPVNLCWHCTAKKLLAEKKVD